MALVGIDLGTTNSAVALWTEDGPKLVPNALGEKLTPSVVGLDDDNAVLVGQSARNRDRPDTRLVTSAITTIATTMKNIGCGPITPAIAMIATRPGGLIHCTWWAWPEAMSATGLATRSATATLASQRSTNGCPGPR